MGAGHTKLTAQSQPLVGDKAILPTAASGAPLTLTLVKGTADDALESAFVDPTGALAVTQIRSHMPHNAVAAEYAGNIPFTGAVPAPATLHYVAPDSSTVAVLYNGENDTSAAGLHVSALMQDWTWCSADGYRNGEGKSTLYVATPSGAASKFYDSVPTKLASEIGVAGQACSICVTNFEAGDSLKVLPCGHAFRPKCIQEWLTNHSSCPLCRKTSKAAPVLADGAILHGGDILRALAIIAPVMTEKQQKNAGYDYRYEGGLGLFPIKPDGTFSAQPVLKFDGEKVKTVADKKCVAKCPVNNGDKPMPKKFDVAPGVDPVLALALASEWEANRRGVENAPGGSGLGG